MALEDPSLQASKTEKCLEKFLAPCILSNVGRIVCLVVYAALIGVAVYGCTKVEIDFKVTYFIGETSPVYGYFELNDKYFGSGSDTTIYVESQDLDLASEETQKKMLLFNAKL